MGFWLDLIGKEANKKSTFLEHGVDITKPLPNHKIIMDIQDYNQSLIKQVKALPTETEERESDEYDCGLRDMKEKVLEILE